MSRSPKYCGECGRRFQKMMLVAFCECRWRKAGQESSDHACGIQRLSPLLGYCVGFAVGACLPGAGVLGLGLPLPMNGLPHRMASMGHQTALGYFTGTTVVQELQSLTDTHWLVSGNMHCDSAHRSNRVLEMDRILRNAVLTTYCLLALLTQTWCVKSGS